MTDTPAADTPAADTPAADTTATGRVGPGTVDADEVARVLLEELGGDRWARLGSNHLEELLGRLLAEGELDQMREAAARRCADGWAGQGALTTARVPAAVIAEMAASDAPRLRQVAAAARSLPAAAARDLAASDDETVRTTLAGNAHAPDDVLAALAGDTRQEVRAAAVGNPATPLAAVAARLVDRARQVPPRATSQLLHRCHAGEHAAAEALAEQALGDLLRAADEDGHHARRCPAALDVLLAAQLLGGRDGLEQAVAALGGHAGRDASLAQVVAGTWRQTPAA